MPLSDRYPKIFETLEDKALQIRHLLSVDENYYDFDSEEFEFDSEEYNKIVYVTDILQSVLGEEKLNELAQRLEAHEKIDNFLRSEADLFAMQCDLSEEETAHLILAEAEALV